VAGGDQLASTLGVLQHGIIPGIATIDAIAADVSASNLSFSPGHTARDPRKLDVAFLNAKGFGGNNATATILAGHITQRLLHNKHGAKTMAQWQDRVEHTRERAAAYDVAASAGDTEVIYRFDHHVRDAEHIHIDQKSLYIDGYELPVSLEIENPLGVDL
jgi:acetoacetyl-[acyl-carrier protein] synthase